MYIIMKTETFAKLFFVISFTGLIMYAILAFYTFHTSYTTVSDYETYSNSLPKMVTTTEHETYDNELKYILIWTIPTFENKIFEEGQAPFVKADCSYSNCFVTTKKDLLNDDYSNFDAIIFDVNVLRRWRNVSMPQVRKAKQKYVFYGLKSSEMAPICQLKVDGFFNWTWSYKLSSDIVTPFIEVTDLKGTVVAPKQSVTWELNKTELSPEIRDKLITKKKAVAWIMKSCKPRADRMKFVNALKNALNEHSLDLDVLDYGCNAKSCPNDDCLKLVKRDYFYYLAFEHSLAEDYVTEEVLKAYDNYAVPIVKNGAFNSLFLPKDSYLDAEKTGVNKLASFIQHSLMNLVVYYRMHQWRNHYVIRSGNTTRGICNLCELLHTRSRVTTTYKDFRRWWYKGPLADRCLPKGAEAMEEVLSYLNNTRKRIHRI